MIDRKVGVVTSHNEPSSLSPVEKAARARRRRLERDINLLKIRIRRFSSVEQVARNPVKRATAQAEVAVARMNLEKAEAELATLDAVESVN